MKLIISALVILCSVILLSFVSGCMVLNSELKYDAPLSFEITPGETFYSALAKVSGKVENFPVKFSKIYIKLMGYDKDLKVGEYEVAKRRSAIEIIHTMTEGQVIEKAVTFQEGLNIYQIAEILEAEGLVEKKEDFILAAKNKELASELLGFSVPSLEGYLFPDTYKLPKNWSAESYVKAFVKKFKSVWQEVQSKNKTKMTRHQVVILASLIEKETGDPSERPMISSVFHNRLRKPMRLQSDPTTIYGIWVETGKMLKNITRKDLQKPTPYNTYTVNGLPKGPIANPGKAALLAAISPLESKNYYFVSRNDGTHKFSQTYKEHQKAVRDFQLDPKAREGKSWRDLNKK